VGEITRNRLSAKIARTFTLGVQAIVR
jgi:hypothetical protein